MKDKKSHHKEQENLTHGSHRLVSLIGYSQSGKSTRISCLQEHLRELFITAGASTISLGGGITMRSGRQSRHIAPRFINVRFRDGEILFASIDYTGQDHQAAYYFLKQMFMLITTIKNSGGDINNLFNEIMSISYKIIQWFSDINTTLEREELEDIIFDPFKPFRDYADKYGLNLDYIYLNVIIEKVLNLMLSPSQKDFINNLKDIWDKEGEKNVIKYLKNFLRDTLNIKDLDKFNKFNVIQLNRILCKLDTWYPEPNTTTICDSGENINYDRPIGDYAFIRGIITGPLLAYLLLGLVINSWITFILMPSDLNKWYDSIKNLYQYKSDEDYINHLNVFTELDNEIDSEVRNLCSELVHQYTWRNYREIYSDQASLNSIIEVICGGKVICPPLRFDEPNDEHSKKIAQIVRNIREHVCHKNLIIIWGEAIAKIYHYKLITILLHIYSKYLEVVKDRKLEKYFVFDLTYSDDKSFIDNIKTVLSFKSQYQYQNKSINYIVEFNNIINALENIKEHNIGIYFIPSTIGGSAQCTPFEAISIVCLSNRYTKVKVINSDTGDEREIECNSIMKGLDIRKLRMSM
ncbi:MAG: hypothetical protein QXL19_09305 [Ignisphaera sp.]